MQYMTKLSYALVLMLLSLAALAGADKQPANVESDFERIVVELEQHFATRNEERLGALFDIDKALERAFEQSEVDEAFQRGFNASFKPELARMGIGGMLLHNIRGEVQSKLVTSHRYNSGGGNAIYRFTGSESEGFVYMKMILKPIEGKLKVVDWFDYARGQLYSDSLSGLIQSLMPSKGILGTVSDIVKQKHIERLKFSKILTLARTQQFAELRSYYQQHKDFAVTSWELMSIVATSAAVSGDEVFYREALSDMAKQYKNDPRASFMLLDYYFYGKDLPNALAILDLMSKNFDNKDGSIYFMKSNLYMQTQKWPEALESVNQCIAIEPGFEDCYWNWVTHSISTAQYDQTVKSLKTIEAQFGYEFTQAALEQEPFYADFVKSQAFKQWLN